MQKMEDGGQDESENCNGKQCGVETHEPRIDLLRLVFDSTGELCGSEYQKKIAEDRSGDGRFDERDEARVERKAGDYQLRKISKCGVELSAECRSSVRRDLLRRGPEHAGQRKYRERAERKNEEWRRVKKSRADCNRNKDEQCIKQLHLAEACGRTIGG
jgi:hypothetical protein